MSNTESQTSQILNHLLSGCKLTAMEALRYYNCWRLSGRIKDLRYKGFDIKTEMIVTGTRKRIAQYSI